MSDLEAFPRPSVAVDVAVCSVVDGRLSVLLHRGATDTNPEWWSLPGSFVREREWLKHAVTRTLCDKCGVEAQHPRQLAVLDDPDRDNRGWVLSVAHLDTVPTDRAVSLMERTDVVWTPVADDARGLRLRVPGKQRRLPYDHDRIVELAVAALRSRYAERPDPSGLLTGAFTVSELRRLHEAVLGEDLQKDTFRRAMLPGLRALASTGRGSVGRPARLYRRR